MNTDDQIKLAQAQLIQHTAEQMGVDVNELSSEELAKFASYVLSEVGENEEQAKVAEADALGRFMARSFVEEQEKIAAAQQVQGTVASAMEDIAGAWSEKVAGKNAARRKAEKKRLKRAAMNSTPEVIPSSVIPDAVLPETPPATTPTTPAELSRLQKMRAAISDFYTGDFTRAKDLQGMDKAKAYGMGTAKALGTLGAAGALGYGAYRAMGGGEDEAKVAHLLKIAADATDAAVALAADAAAAPDAVAPAASAAKAEEIGRIRRALNSARDFYTSDFTRGAGLSGMDKAKAYGMGGAKALGTLGAAGALGYGAYRGLGYGDEEAKVAHLLKIAAEATDAAVSAAVDAAAAPDAVAPAASAAKAEEIGRIRRALNSARDFYTRDFTAGATAEGFGNKAKAYGMGAAKALGTLGAAGALGYGAYRGLGYGGDEEAKVAGYEFAKLAEARAAEIMAANGIHPETFEAIEPVAVKIAQVSTPDDFYTYEEKVASYQFNQELNEAASHILNSLGLV